MINQKYLIESSTRLLEEGKDIEEVLYFLRQNKCSKIQSILILQKIQNITHDEAKIRVHFSRTWQDTREYDEEVEKVFFDFLEQYNPEEDEI